MKNWDYRMHSFSKKENKKKDNQQIPDDWDSTRLIFPQRTSLYYACHTKKISWRHHPGLSATLTFTFVEQNNIEYQNAHFSSACG